MKKALIVAFSIVGAGAVPFVRKWRANRVLERKVHELQERFKSLDTTV